MKLRLSGETEARDVTEFTVIAYAQPKTRPWSGLCGDTAVTFEEQADGTITVTVQQKPSGPGARMRQVTQYLVRPWEE